MTEPRTHCRKAGHPLSGDNVYIANGRRRCHACDAAKKAAKEATKGQALQLDKLRRIAKSKESASKVLELLKQEKTYEEIAALLGTSKGTVAGLLWRHRMRAEA
jgi:DNA invertase Pin-like site-specific DNA recombinase